MLRDGWKPSPTGAKREKQAMTEKLPAEMAGSFVSTGYLTVGEAF